MNQLSSFPASPRAARILIVEDDSIVAMDLRQRLARHGYSVPEPVYSGEAALTAMDSSAHDLVLMDIRLPGRLSGTDAARTIRKRYNTPIIYLTAYTDSTTIAQVLESGGDGFVAKPYSPAGVHAAIQLVLARVSASRGEPGRESKSFSVASGHAEVQSRLQPLTTRHRLTELVAGARGLIGSLAGSTNLDRNEREVLSRTDVSLLQMAVLLDEDAGGLPENGERTEAQPADAVLQRVLEDLAGDISRTGAGIAADRLPSVRVEAFSLYRLFHDLLTHILSGAAEGTAPEIRVSAEKGRTEVLIRIEHSGWKKPDSGGEGPGLAICREIVQAYGGRLWLDTQQRPGSRIAFTLPC